MSLATKTDSWREVRGAVDRMVSIISADYRERKRTQLPRSEPTEQDLQDARAAEEFLVRPGKKR